MPQRREQTNIEWNEMSVTNSIRFLSFTLGAFFFFADKLEVGRYMKIGWARCMLLMVPTTHTLSQDFHWTWCVWSWLRVHISMGSFVGPNGNWFVEWKTNKKDAPANREPSFSSTCRSPLFSTHFYCIRLPHASYARRTSYDDDH